MIDRRQLEPSARFFSMLATVSERFLELHTRLRARFDTDVTFSQDCRYYEDGPRMDWFLEVRLSISRTLIWGLDVAYLYRDHEWLVESSIEELVSGGDGAATITNFPQRRTANDVDLISFIDASLHELDVASASMDFGTS